MTETERRALALVNGDFLEVNVANMSAIAEAYRNLHKQHEAFRQEVSDACKKWTEANVNCREPHDLDRFIIAKPDPLEEVIADYKRTKGGGEYATNKDMAAALRAALEARGLKIVEVGHD